MKFQASVLCTGIKQSNVTIEGRNFSSTTFHLLTDIADNSAGGSIGMESRPFKFGDASEFDKWSHLDKSWPQSGLPCVAEFEVQSSKTSDGAPATKLALLSIRPAAQTAPQQSARATA